MVVNFIKKYFQKKNFLVEFLRLDLKFSLEFRLISWILSIFGMFAILDIIFVI